MARVPGGVFQMGSIGFYPEERPVRPTEVDPLWFDEHPVTNEEFGRFIADTSYVTVAEQTPDTQDFPDADPALLVPGSQVFVPTPGPVDLHDWMQWWYWVPGADWRHPEGPDSDVRGKEQHPVVHVGLEDARAYAEWAEKRLPTEAEWEHAARGGLDGATYAWGDEFMPDGRIMANTWHGMFPFENRHPHGFTRTSPVKHFPPNGYSLYDVAGNVWEWTSTRWSPDHAQDGPPHTSPEEGACCGPGAPVREADRFVIKGGSHLCASSYCRRYRPSARQPQGPRDTASHLGFRCVRAC